MADFLLEIGLDEIPARMIATAEAELGRRVLDLLTRERLLAPSAKLTTFSTPRRLAVLVEGVLARQADTEEQLTGPSWKIAFKDGAPTPAAEAFAKKAGVPVSALEKVTTAKGEYVGATVKREGVAAPQVLTADLPKEILALYWAKNMYWRAGKPERFVRPIRWVVALLDSAVVPLEIAGIAASNTSRGHRVLHGEAPVVIDQPRNYSERLRGAAVIVDVAERKEKIRKALDKVTRTIPGARWREDEPLVDTVLHLTEWPSVILGNFDREYLALPEEVLVTVMRDHQKYFAVEDANGKLAPHFLAVLNTATDAEGESIIRHGNERVLISRFKDARFFWDFDQKIPLTARVESLKNVTFQKQLGSYWAKTQKNISVVNSLACFLQSRGVEIDHNALMLATELAKTDLTTELVKEFTELQGVIGGLYARAQGLGDKTAQAIYDQYTPAAIDDPIPLTIEGQLLGLADRIQTIVALFSIDLIPTGSRDPFALRRAANGIVKILSESDLPVTISNLLGWSSELLAMAINTQTEPKLRGFFRERVEFWLRDVRNFAYDVVNAVLAAGADDVRDAIARAEALSAARETEDFAAILVAFRRIKNILRQAAEKQYRAAVLRMVLASLSPEGQRLFEEVNSLGPKVEMLSHQRAYAEALALIATLRPAVDTFFDKVMVLDPDESIRGANLALIDEVLQRFSGIADFSEIVTG